MKERWFWRYSRRPVGALFWASAACGTITTALRIAGNEERARGASYALVAVFLVQWVYSAFVAETPDAQRRKP